MAKFCTYCGKPLEDGEVCTCRAEAAPEVIPAATPEAAPAPAAPAAPIAPAAPAAPGKAKVMLDGYIAFFKNYFKAPVNVTREAAGKMDMTNAIITAVIYALAYGLFAYAACSKFFGAMKDFMEDTLGGFGSEIEITVPFLTILIFGILAAAVALAVFSLAVFAIAKIAKKNITFKHAIIIVGINAAIPAACTLAALVALFISAKLAIVLLSLGCVITYILYSAVTLKVLGIEITGALTIIMAVILVVALTINCWAGFKLNLKAIGKVEGNGESLEDTISDIEDTFDELKDMDLMEIIYDLM